MLKFGSKSDVTVLYRATIRLLDDTEIIHCDFQPQHKGKYILEYVCKQLNILETDYFGLRYVDNSRQRHWLDLAKTAIKQVKDMDPILFSFRVKFYPPDPLRLKEDITRYQIYLQLKRDLLHGRLYCSPGEAALLAACIIQSELGDYDPELHEGNYMAEHKLLLKQTETIEERALELHQTQLKGFSPEQAELQFLKLAAQLDTYAVDPHPVKDHKGSPLYLGINHCGILTFQGSRKTNHFRWPEVQKINYEGKMFIVHLTITEKKHTVGFKCPTGSNCRHVWRCAIEQMLFFTLPRASDAPVMSGGSIFSWGTKFKYTGRTEREVLEESGPLRKEEPPIQRCGSSTGLRRKASSVPATPSTPSQDLVEIRYSSLPRSCHSAGLDGAGMSDIGSGMPLSSPYCPDNTLPLLETVSEDQEIHTRRNNALDETNSHASATTTTTTTTTCTITTTTTTTNTAPNTTTTATTMSDSTDDTSLVTNHQAKQLKKYPKNTLQTRPQALYSQRIVIGSEELSGQDIGNVVRQKIHALEKSPKVVRSTALIVKRSVAPAKTRPAASTPAIAAPPKPAQRLVPNGDLKPNTGDGVQQSSNASQPGEDDVDAAVCHDFDGSDYYFRDSFEHSSSESQLLETGSLSAKAGPHGSSRSIAPVPKVQRLQNSKICNVQQSLTSPSSGITSPAGIPGRHLAPRQAHMAATASSGSSSVQYSHRLRGCRAQLVRLLVPALMLSVTVLLVVTVLVFETDSKLFESLRKTPQMIALRDRCYGPIKKFLKSKLGLF
ncbi:FERM domain-containing protein 5-like isoform X2 [Copidosoma floridanum]|uniref:FERM domain-containing protein 5-like isoform X2 n=1 Tax=Copidosoma floridanum TaxID=29053 RepID=UPI0006C95110|nr:FERM domain-containing protein 5-like isoform X2 [Copidosoma floridanum]